MTDSGTRHTGEFAHLPCAARTQHEKILADQDNATTVAAPMSKNAGISKTRKAHSKRFKITATGKVLRRKQGKRHILVAKNRKRKRNLGKVAVVHETDAAAIKANMPWS
jgi:large subunit ribosomal protein L35